MVGQLDIDFARLADLLLILNHKNVLVFEGAGIKVTLSPSGPPVFGEVVAKDPWENEQ